MVKLILMSILVATVAVPAVCARAADARRGLKRTVALLVAFDVLYLALLLLVYVRYFKPEVW